MAYILPSFLLLIGCFWLAAKAAEWLRKRKLKTGGWYFEFISPNQLRGEKNEYAFVYRTLNHEVWFVGIEGEKPLSPRFFNSKEESRVFYEQNKSEIHARLKSELSRWPKSNFCVEEQG